MNLDHACRRPAVEALPEPPVDELLAEEYRAHLFAAIDTLSDEAVLRLWPFMRSWLQTLTPMLVVVVSDATG